MTGPARPLARRRLRLAGAAAMAAVALVMFLQAGTALVVAMPVERPDAIVSLASHEWERLPTAARLARDYPQAHVFLTEPAVVTRYNCHDCPNRARYLASLGIDPRRISIVRLQSSSTYGEAVAIEAAIRGTDIRRILIVTSPYHTRRALAVFRHAMRADAVRVGIVPALGHSPAVPARWWSAPYDRWYVTYEWSAMFTYFFAGRLQVSRG